MSTLNECAKEFIRDDGSVYRVQECQVTAALLADDRALATIVRRYVEEFGAAVVRVVQCKHEWVATPGFFNAWRGDDYKCTKCGETKFRNTGY